MINLYLSIEFASNSAQPEWNSSNDVLYKFNLEIFVDKWLARPNCKTRDRSKARQPLEKRNLKIYGCRELNNHAEEFEVSRSLVNLSRTLSDTWRMYKILLCGRERCYSVRYPLSLHLNAGMWKIRWFSGVFFSNHLFSTWVKKNLLGTQLPYSFCSSKTYLMIYICFIWISLSFSHFFLFSSKFVSDDISPLIGYKNE